MSLSIFEMPVLLATLVLQVPPTADAEITSHGCGAQARTPIADCCVHLPQWQKHAAEAAHELPPAHEATSHQGMTDVDEG